MAGHDLKVSQQSWQQESQGEGERDSGSPAEDSQKKCHRDEADASTQSSPKDVHAASYAKRCPKWSKGGLEKMNSGR